MPPVATVAKTTFRTVATVRQVENGVNKRIPAFAVRYLTKRFIGEYDANKEMLYTHKTMFDGGELVLEILDTANDGGEELLETHIKWADGIVLLYSVIDKQSLQHLDYFHTLITHVRRHEDVTPIVVIGNKIDQSLARKVTTSEGQSLAAKYECPWFEVTIAESKDGVISAMDNLLSIIKREYGKCDGFGRKSTFNNVKKVFKKKVTRSRSDSFFR